MMRNLTLSSVNCAICTQPIQHLNAVQYSKSFSAAVNSLSQPTISSPDTWYMKTPSLSS